jgi:hypothetical protein
VQIDFEVEDFHWVPKKAIDLMVSLLGRQFPDLPAAPFMCLLVQLNKVWHVRERSALRRLQKGHEQEMRTICRMQQEATPYQQNIIQQRLDFVSSQLKLSSVLLSL